MVPEFESEVVGRLSDAAVNTVLARKAALDAAQRQASQSGWNVGDFVSELAENACDLVEGVADVADLAEGAVELMGGAAELVGGAVELVGGLLEGLGGLFG
jgi:X-X-X-Leu-X-X-Gly heptad repeat protein